MPFIVPNSEVILYSNIKITDGEQIAFPSLSSQTAYFTRHIVTRVQNCSYIRKTGYVRLEVPTSTVSGCNYLSFKNSSFENKTIYARILNWEYVNNVTTDVLYTIDWFQTYCFDVDYENAYIAREHLSETDWSKAETNPFDATIYEFQTSENLPVGHMLEDIPSIEGGSAHVFGTNATEHFTIIMYIAAFNHDEFVSEYNDFLDIFDYVIQPDGTKTPTAIDAPMRIPRAYGIYCIKYNSVTSQERKFYQALDWLALHNVSHQIIGVYALPESIVDDYMMHNTFTKTLTVHPLTSGRTNKKLYLSPFTYIRVYNNEGDIKEYRFEDFRDIRENRNRNAVFYLVLIMDGCPMVTVVPRRYGVTINNAPPSGSNVNVLQEVDLNERIDMHNIMQLGYSNDAYLSYLSTQYAKTVGTRTTNDEDYDAKRAFAGGVSAVVGAVGSVLNAPNSGATGMIGGLTESWDRMNQIEHAVQKDYKEPSLIEQARSTGVSNSEIDGVFGNAKRVFVANEYHAGSDNGALQFYAGFALNPNWYMITQVQLKDSILDVYDRFFSMYGYTSNKISVPRICNYIKGSSNNDILPHFDRVIEQTGTTYCCTKNMHVISPMSAVSNYIEELFNKGCRFHKGDELT